MPGTIIREGSQSTQRGLPTDTGVAFVAALCDRGRLGEPNECKSLVELVKKTGGRTTYSLLYDWADAFFRRGGSKMYVSRILGPAVSTTAWSGHATKNLLDSGAGISLVAYAASPGPWGNNLRIAVLAGDVGGQFKIQVTDTSDSTVNEISPSFATQQNAIDYYATSDLVRFVLGVTALNPAVAGASAFTGGVDDRSNVTDTEAQRALDAFNKDLGPGQVAYVGRTTAAAWAQLLAHGKSRNRRAIVDPADAATQAGFSSQVVNFTALADSKYGAMFGPWYDLPGLNGGSARPVPPSAVVCGAISANDGNGVSPNQPSAGDYGVIDVQRLRATFSEAEVQTLTDQGFNCIITKAGVQKIYGWRTGALKGPNPNWWQFGNSRFYMKVAALGNSILEGYVLREVDGAQVLFKDLEGRLTGMLLQFWPGSLYGATPGEAFFVDTGPDINTDTTIGNGEIHAAIELTMNSMGETVVLDLIKRQIGS